VEDYATSAVFRDSIPNYLSLGVLPKTAMCHARPFSPALLKSVEPIVEVLDDVLPLGRGEFLLCHVGAVFYLLLQTIQLGILRVRAVTPHKGIPAFGQ